MAFNFFLHRASASILTRGIGSVGRVISAVINVQKRHLVGRQFLPFSRFSTIPFDKLLGVGESAHSDQQSFNMNFPDEFPFGVEENKMRFIDFGKRYLLRRRYQDEIIEVAFDGYEVIGDTPEISLNAHVLRGSQCLLFEGFAEPNRIVIETFTIMDSVTHHVKAFQNYLESRGFNSSMINFLPRLVESNCNSQQSSNVNPPHLVPDGFPFEIQLDKQEKGVALSLRRRFEDESIIAEVFGLSACVSDNENTNQQFKMTVKVRRGRGYEYESKFMISVFPHSPDPILIRQVSITRGRFGHLDEFQNFLEMRGIKPSTTNFLFDYFSKKVEQKYRRIGVKLLPQF